MGAQTGRNAGITGFFDITVGGANIKFYAKLNKYSAAFRAAVIPRTGRGSAGGQKVRLGNLVGSGGSAKGTLQPGQFPAPAVYQNASGTLTVQIYAGCSFSCPVKCPGITIGRVEAEQDLPSASLSWEINGYPAWTWNGTQQAATTPSYNTIELYEGILKRLDPQSITDGASQVIDIETIGDDDTSELAVIAGLIAAAITPVTGYKLIEYSFTRTDFNGGRLALRWGLKDSKDEIEMAESAINVDPADLDTAGRVTKVYLAAAGVPADPTPPSHTKIVSTVIQQVNIKVSKKAWTVAAQTSQDKIEQGGTWAYVDVSGLESEALGTTVDGVPTTPAGFVVVGDKTFALSDFHSVTQRRFGLQTPAQRVLNTHGVSKRSFLEPDMDLVPSLYFSTDSAETISDALVSSFAAETHAIDLEVRKLLPGVGLVLKRYLNPGVMIVGRGYRSWQPAIGKLDTSGMTPVVRVFIGRVKQFDGTDKWAILTPVHETRIIRRFTLLRWFPQGTTIPEFPTLYGQTNNADFLGPGNPAGSCVYEGPEYGAKIGNPNSGPFRMGYNFCADSLGVFNLRGWEHAILTAASVSPGWVDAADLGMDYDVPPQGDFSVFTD